ncbi:hypothetical protein B4U78_015985 [Microbacterium esteraromaticum]|nr:hypothetical protein B4U78_015985 [Microbacterium esteraromaticum]
MQIINQSIVLEVIFKNSNTNLEISIDEQKHTLQHKDNSYNPFLQMFLLILKTTLPLNYWNE